MLYMTEVILQNSFLLNICCCSTFTSDPCWFSYDEIKFFSAVEICFSLASLVLMGCHVHNEVVIMILLMDSERGLVFFTTQG